MIEHGGLAPLRIDQCVDPIAHAQYALCHGADVGEGRTAVLVGVLDVEARTVAFQPAAVADLPAGLGVERRRSRNTMPL